MDVPPPLRRWWQRTPVRWSVRALMVAVLVAAVGLGWVVHRARVQRDAVAAIEKGGGKAFYDWQLTTVTSPDFVDLTPKPSGQPRGPKWLAEWVGPDYFDTIKMVILFGPADPLMPHVGQLEKLEEIDFLPGRKEPGYGPSDDGMAYLKGLNQLKHIKLSVNTLKGIIGSKITGKGLESIKGAIKLQILELNGAPLNDQDLAPLRGFTNLRLLELGSPNITDAGLEHLVGLVEMRRLTLEGTRVTSNGIKSLQGMKRLNQLDLSMSQVESLENFRTLPSLTNLTLVKNPVNDAGLVPSSDPGFASLTVLNLFGTRVGDDGLKSLKDLPKLIRLVLTGTEVTDAGVAAFQKDRPKVKISRQKMPGPNQK